MLKEKLNRAPPFVEGHIREPYGSMLTEKLRDSEGYFPIGTERTLRLQGEERRDALEGRAHGSVPARSLVCALRCQPTA